jgi:hypothetical protein
MSSPYIEPRTQSRGAAIFKGLEKKKLKKNLNQNILRPRGTAG